MSQSRFFIQKPFTIATLAAEVRNGRRKCFTIVSSNSPFDLGTSVMLCRLRR